MPLDVLQAYLDYLVSTREIRAFQVGKVKMYEQFIKIIDIKDSYEKELGDKTYSFTEIKNEHGHMVLIQELQKDEYGHAEPIGGILIPINQLGPFVDALLDAKFKE